MALTVFMVATAGLAWGAARMVLGPTWYTVRADVTNPPGKKIDKPADPRDASDTTSDGKDQHKPDAPKVDGSDKGDGTPTPGPSGQDVKGIVPPPSSSTSDPGPTTDGTANPSNGTSTDPSATGSDATAATPPGPTSPPATTPDPGLPPKDTTGTETPPDRAVSPTDAKVDPRPGEKGEDTAATSNDGLLQVEEWRAPAGGGCQDLLYQSQRPQISVLNPSGGRLQASSMQGLCALVFRTTEGNQGYSILVDRRLTTMTMDAPPGAFGRGDRRAGEVVRFFRGRDSAQGLTYNIVLRPSNPSANNGEVRFTHELRR
jgi:hypothetical protein